MASRTRSMSPTTSFESLSLSANRAKAFFANSFCDDSSICLNVLRQPLRLVATVVNRCTHLVNPTRRSVSSGSPSIVVVVMCCLNLSNCGISSPIFSVTSSNCCGRLCQFNAMAVHSRNTYLIMIDQRAHPSEGGLERREPICGFLRNIEENLRAVHDSLLCC